MILSILDSAVWKLSSSTDNKYNWHGMVWFFQCGLSKYSIHGPAGNKVCPFFLDELYNGFKVDENDIDTCV